MAISTKDYIQVIAWPGFGGGLRTDEPPTKIPDNAVWDSLNTIFDRNIAIKRGGITTYQNLKLDTVIRLIDEWYDSTGTQWLMLATNDKFYTYNVGSNVLTDRTPATGIHGIIGVAYTGAGFYGKYYLSSGNDSPIYWDGISALATVLNTTGAPKTAIQVIPFADHLLWLNVTDSVLGYEPQEIIWSDLKNGLVYNSGDAAVITIEDTNDVIVSAELVTNYLAIARAKSIYTSQFIGYPFFYRFDRRVERFGIVATNTFKKTEQFILGFSPNGVISFDGANLNGYVGQNIKDDMFLIIPQNVFVGGSISIFDFSSIKWRLIVSSRVDGFPDTEYSYSELYQSWSKNKYSVPITALGTFKSGIYPTWNQLTNAWNTYQTRWSDPLITSVSPSIVCGDNSGNIYLLGSLANDNGQAISAFFRTKPSELKMSGFIKELNRLQFLLAKQTVGTLTVHVFESDDGENFVESLNSPYMLDMTQSIIPFIDVFAVGTWFYLQIVNNNLNETFEIHEIRAEFTPLAEVDH